MDIQRRRLPQFLRGVTRHAHHQCAVGDDERRAQQRRRADGDIALQPQFVELVVNDATLFVPRCHHQMASFLVEIVGLLLIWQAGEPWMVQTGALLAGAGFSLVFPALGVEAVKQVPPQNQGTALGTYSAFLDLALGITGPLAGLLIGQTGVPSIYLAAALLVALGVLLTLRLLQRSRA